MTVVCPEARECLTFGQQRTDALASALRLPPVPVGGPLPALWHWASVVPACAPRSSVRVRLFQAAQAGVPVAVSPPPEIGGANGPRTIAQGGRIRVQTLTAPLVGRAPHPDQGLETDGAELVGDSVDLGQLLQLFSSGQDGSAKNRALGFLAAEHLTRRTGGQLIAIEFNFWSLPASVRSCRFVACPDGEGRTLFQVGAPGEPGLLSGTAWFGCGPGPRPQPEG